MKKREFEYLIGEDISDENYKVIETVYKFHPSIQEVSGKDEVAELYKSFGMTIFLDMLLRAERNRDLERDLSYAQAIVEQIKEEKEKLLKRAEVHCYGTSAQNQNVSLVHTPITCCATADEIRQSMKKFRQYQFEQSGAEQTEDAHGK